MGEQIYTDQNGFQFVYNPINPTNLEDGRPMPVSKKRNTSSASSRYKADPLRSHQSNTFDTRLTEVDTDEENYLVPNSAEMVKLDPNGCKYTKVNVPVINDSSIIINPTTTNKTSEEEEGGEEEPQKHHYQNDGIGAAEIASSEYLNVDETTTEEDEIAMAPFGGDTVKQQQQQQNPSIGSTNDNNSSSFSKLGNAYINQAESVV
uniref:Uncharacterized protein n=1 Tax=Panagrolaimus superbus TaxID=310955 RepID=A0A914YBZ3_9BILA